MTEEPYEPTRAQRRCKHPKWVEVYRSRFSGTIEERCTKCQLLRKRGGLFEKLNLQLGTK